jgi:hypothetical protein
MMDLTGMFGALAKTEKTQRDEHPQLFARDGEKIEYVTVLFATLDWEERDFARTLCRKCGGFDGGVITVNKEVSDFNLSAQAHAYFLPPSSADKFKEAVHSMIDFYRITIQPEPQHPTKKHI